MADGSILVRDVMLLDADHPDQARRGMDIGIRAGAFALVQPTSADGPPAGQWDRVIDGRGLIAMPGLVNAHSHTYETFTRGLIINRPVGLYALYAHPVLGVEAQSPEQLYIRTLAGCIEMLRQGVTTVYDDISLFFDYRIELVQAIHRAYRDAGMRALVGIKVMDKRLYQTLPFAEKDIPPDWKREMDAVPVPTLEGATAFSERCFELADADGLVRCGATPSAPQRSSDELLKRQYAMACSAGFPYMLHVQETRLQAKQGPKLYGHSMIAQLHKLGVLGPSTGIIHGVWLSDGDVELLARSGAGVIHNPVSNLRVGSGIAPLRRLVNAGVPLALGCDGTSSNDSQSILETMKIAAILHSVTTTEYEDWMNPVEIYRMATAGGARIGLMSDRIGAVTPGRRADLVLLAANSMAFRPMNAPISQLVYGPTGIDIHSVLVDGRCVVDARRVTTVDEDQVTRELQVWSDRYRPIVERTFEIARQLEPTWRRMYLQHVNEA